MELSAKSGMPKEAWQDASASDCSTTVVAVPVVVSAV